MQKRRYFHSGLILLPALSVAFFSLRVPAISSLTLTDTVSCDATYPQSPLTPSHVATNPMRYVMSNMTIVPVHPPAASRMPPLNTQKSRGTADTTLAAGHISLSKTSAKPGEVLEITGSEFDPQASTVVKFTDEVGNSTDVVSMSATTTTIRVAVPFWVDVKTFLVEPRTVSVSVTQESPSKQTVYGPKRFHVADLPQIRLAPGAVSVKVLEQLQRVLTMSSQGWFAIRDATSNRIDLSLLAWNLDSMSRQLKDAQQLIQGVQTQRNSQIKLGTVNNHEVYLDQRALVLLDRIFVAYLLEEPDTGAISQVSRHRPSRQNPTDPLVSIEDQFTKLIGSMSPGQILHFAERLRGGASVGMGTAKLVMSTLEAESRVPVSSGENSGAILWAATVWLPASVVPSLQGGISVIFNGGGTAQKFRNVTDFVSSKLTRNILNSATTMDGKFSGDLGMIASMLTRVVQELPLLLDFNNPSSLGSQLAADFDSISSLLPPNSLTYVGTFVGTVLEQSNVHAPKNATLSGNGLVKLSESSMGFELTGVVRLVQNGDIQHNYSGEYAISKRAETIGDVTFSFGPVVAKGRLGGHYSFAGSWGFVSMSGSDVANGVFHLTLQDGTTLLGFGNRNGSDVQNRTRSAHVNAHPLFVSKETIVSQTGRVKAPSRNALIRRDQIE